MAFFDSVDKTLADEKDIFDTFRTNLSIAEKEAEDTEEANGAVLEAINHALQSDPAAAFTSLAPAAPNASGAASSTPAAPSAQPADVPTPAGAMPEF